MKRALSVALAFLIIFCVVYVIRPGGNMKFDIKYISEILQYLGSFEPPELTGGHTFDTFLEGSQAVLWITTYPFRWAFYAVGQITRFVSLFFGFSDLVPNKGFGGGIYG